MKLSVNLTLTLAATIILTGAGCAQNTSKPISTAVIPEGYATHDVAGQHFTISYPSNWEDNRTDIEGTDYEALFYAPYENDEDVFADNFSVNEIVAPKNNLTIKQYFDTNMAAIESEGGYKHISTTDITTDGYAAKRWEATKVSEKSGELHFVQAYALTPDNAYVVTCTMSESSKDLYIDSCDKIIGSLKFR